MPVSAVPEWSGVRADQIARIEIGGTPSRSIPKYWADGKDGHLWVSIADMSQTRIETTSERITDAGIRFSNVKLVPAGTPLMSFKLTVGRVAVAGRELYTNEAIAAFHVNADRADPRWLVHALPTACARAITDTAVKGVTLNKAKLERLTLDLPPLPEQRAIAEVLDTVDEAILGTEQLIAKLKQMRYGLLNDLLTRGIDGNGELRDPQRHAAFFKDSRLGLVPESWEVVSLGSQCRIRRGASPRPIDDPRWFASSGPGWVRIADVTRAQDRLEATTQYLSEAGAALSVRVTSGQVIMSIAATVGLVIVVGMDACIHDGFVVFDHHAKTIDADFLALALQLYRPSFIKRGQTGTQANINTKIVESTLIALPGIEEQQLIIGVNEGLRAQERAERLTLQKLRLLEQGLTEDLLSGRVRVTRFREGDAA